MTGPKRGAGMSECTERSEGREGMPEGGMA
jgi:hypothetical protein